MAQARGREEVLKSLLEAAGKRWDKGTVANLRFAFELAADLICKVEQFKLEPEEEPAQPTVIFRLGSLRKGQKTEE